MPFGAELTGEACRFALWTPTAAEVSLIVRGSEHPMPDRGDGWRELILPGVSAGARYAYRIDEALIVADPASRFQPDGIGEESAVIDPLAYDWSDEAWRGRPWEEAVLYELHVGTATPEGSFAGLLPRLPELARLGVTAIELMPLADFPGRRNWGYDGVLPFAPAAAYGTPDDLKLLVDTAHRLRLMVLIDVVYNHFGPSGNYLRAYAASFFTDRHRTPWGDAINFDGEGSAVVREFFLHNALYWLEEFRCDGLRFDAVHAIRDAGPTHFLQEISRGIRERLPDRHIHLVLENDANEARYLRRREHGPALFHTAQWNDDLHHAWHVVLSGETEGYYADYAQDRVSRLGRALAEGFVYQGEPSSHRGGKPRGEKSAALPPQAFVAFLQNHDQIGNRAFGERLAHLVVPEKLALARAALLLSPQIPLLFMGEEWAASTPFLYFVDFDADPALATAVREGRRQEFARFSAFSNEGARLKIPDPGDAAAMRRSILVWNERHDPAHAAILAETEGLLRLRSTEIVPLLASAFRGASYVLPAPDALEVVWNFSAGRLRLLLNFGETVLSATIESSERLLWTSPAVGVAGDLAELTGWTGLVAKIERRGEDQTR